MWQLSDPLTKPNVLFWDYGGWACFWPIQVIFVVKEPLCGVGTPSWALITLLKENRVVDNRCNSYLILWQSGKCYFGGDFGWACFWPIQDIFVVAEPLCGVGTPSWALVSLLGSFSENGVVGCRCDSYRIPWQSQTCYFGGVCGWACFWPIQVIFVVVEPLCGVGTPSCSLILYEWLVTNVTAIGPPGRAEHAILEVILARRVFGQFRTYLWSLSHFVM